MKLLIAEDDLTMRTILEGVTRKWGYEPILAEDGLAAWDILTSEEAPLLLLLDWEMPGLDGVELCKRIRSRFGEVSEFIILLTGRSESDDVVAGLEAGANEYIAKPCNHSELKARLYVGKQMLEIQRERFLDKKTLEISSNVFTHSNEGIIITDSAVNIIDINEASSRITGYSRAEILGQNPRFLSSGRQDKSFYIVMWQSINKKGLWSGEIWNRHKDGEVFLERITIVAVKTSGNKVSNYIGFFSDITTQKTHEDDLKRMAHYDLLTSLPNRVLLGDRLLQGMQQAKRKKQKLAVAYLDLDGFKAINDLHGHSVGDHLLMVVAERMKLTLREGDTIARMGGDEFVAVLTEITDTEGFIPVLERLLCAASEPVSFEGLMLEVTISLGVTFYPQADEIEPDQLVRQADQAMYKAKLAGKNCYYHFDLNEDQNIRVQHASLAAIRRGLSNDEFKLYYQPKVNMRTGKVVGAEALIRWQHPEEGLLPPARFLPIIEMQPLSIELGKWVIDNALAQLEIWQSEGLELSISVNVGSYELMRSDFELTLRELLAAHPTADPAKLGLEILETSVLEDLAGICQVMEGCTKMGVTFSLDDFGTGYSSLSHMRHLPAREIKIDQSFVRSMLQVPEDLAILKGVLSLGKAFHRELIAEGVETVEHGKTLLQLGCELGQGYVIARPMPASDIPDWIESWQPDSSWVNQHQLTDDQKQLVEISVVHRAWFQHVEEFLAGKRLAPPELDCLKCDMGRWLKGTAQLVYDNSSVLELINNTHGEMHALARALVNNMEKNSESAQSKDMRALSKLKDTLLSQLTSLIEER